MRSGLRQRWWVGPARLSVAALEGAAGGSASWVTETRLVLKVTYWGSADGSLERAGLAARTVEGGGTRWAEVGVVPLLPGLPVAWPLWRAELVEGTDPARGLRRVLRTEVGWTATCSLRPEWSGTVERWAGRVGVAGCAGRFVFDRLAGGAAPARRAARLAELRVGFPWRESDAWSERLDAIGARVGLRPSRSLVATHLRPGSLSQALRQAASVAPDVRAGDFARRAIHDLAASLVGHEGGAVLGYDPEHVHKARVATRRLRAVVGAFDGVFGAEAKILARELRWLTRELGIVRDLDVCWLESFSWQRELGEEPAAGWVHLREALTHRSLRAQRRLVRALRSARYDRLKKLLARASAGRLAGVGARACEESAVVAARRELERRARRFRRAVRAARRTPSARALHEVRIAGKKLRYTAEVVEPICGGVGRAAVGRLEELQDLLGGLQDRVSVGILAAELARGAAAGSLPTEYRYVLGRLSAWGNVDTAEAAAEVLRALSPFAGKRAFAALLGGVRAAADEVRGRAAHGVRPTEGSTKNADLSRSTRSGGRTSDERRGRPRPRPGGKGAEAGAGRGAVPGGRRRQAANGRV
ncbi:MAG: CHAD domain-containing protein [Deltaproteobacteria bacterium]|nr:CHAD domain-containing protein [Deltaproteobacteria bacterium]